MVGKILVVDDETDIQFIFQSFLSAEKHQVATADDYHSALTLLEQQEFDLVFTDIHLGARSGLDLLKEIRLRGLDCYVIVITGFPKLETVQEALRFGAFDYLVKPVLRETLLRQVRSALEHKSLNDEKETFRRRLSAIFHSVKDAIITVDSDLALMEFNEAAQRICQLNDTDLGRPIFSRERHCGGRCREALDKVVSEKKTATLPRFTCPHGDATEQAVNVSVSPLLDESQQFLGAVMVVRDETRLATLERDLKERRSFHGIIGRSHRMQDVYALIENLADVDTTVLITGSSGTGKELIAEALHFQGARASGPLIKVNCSGLSETLLESELFGHVRGAFTGAVRDKVGRFQMAEGGTIFLDEIGDISGHMQTRLLRVLQNKELERVGDSRTVKINARVVAATNQDLREKIAQGTFREDLFYRLKVVEIRLPSLSERREDLPLLVDHFIRRFAESFGKPIDGVSEEVMGLIMNHPWPGNIRELEHVIEHAFVVCNNDRIEIDHLPPELREANGPGSAFQKLPGGAPVDEREVLLKALEKTAWVKAKTARLLGVSRSTLYRKMAEQGIKEPSDTL